MSQAHMPLSRQVALRLTLDTEPFLSCDDCFDLVDTYVEALLSDPGYDLPAMRTHLVGLVAEQDGLDPAAALSRLEDGPA